MVVIPQVRQCWTLFMWDIYNVISLPEEPVHPRRSISLTSIYYTSRQSVENERRQEKKVGVGMAGELRNSPSLNSTYS